MRVEVFVSTMNQTDYSLIEKMKICTDAVVVNQCQETVLLNTIITEIE